LNARAWLLSFGALLAVLAAGGCNTDVHFCSMPYLDRDLKLTPDELKRKFTDVERYEEVTCPFLAYQEMPPVNELKYACYFGAPAEEGFSWWNLCPLMAVPPFFPCKTVVWERGDYRIRAQVTYPMIFGFKPHLWYWKVDWIPPGTVPGMPRVEAVQVPE